MLTLVLAAATATCSPTWAPNEETRAEPGAPVMLWTDPSTCESLVVTSSHARPEGLRSTVVRYGADGRIIDRFVFPKGTSPSSAIVDAARQRLLVATALMRPDAAEVKIEARRMGDFSLERAFGAAGKTTLTAPRLLPNASTTGGEAVVQVDGQGRVYVVTTVDSVEGLTALYVHRLLSDGRVDPAWAAGEKPVATYERTNSGELVASLTPEGQLVIGAGTKLRPQLFRLTTSGLLDDAFGVGGRAAPAETAAARALAVARDGTLHYASRLRGQQLTTVASDGRASKPLEWQQHDDRLEWPFAVLVLPDGRRAVAATSFSVKAQRASLVVALWSDGRLDTRFGEDGLWEQEEPGINFQSGRAVIMPDGQLLIAARRALAGKPFEGTLALFRLAIPSAQAAQPPPTAHDAAPRPALRGVMPPTKPAPTPADVASQPTTPPPSLPTSPGAAEPGIYVYTDAQGVETYVDSLEQVPPKLRAKARRVSP
ncbi:MAG: hypothetical protein AB1938_05480 [Myxococcota bacterium]